MPQALLHPGVYIEEVPSGVRTITGVATSVAAFIGYTARGPVDTAVQIFSFADFERQFGGLHRDSTVSYAVSHFFLNGGGSAWVVRVAAGAAKASVEIKNGVGAAPAVLVATAVSAGAWGNGIELVVDYATSNPASLFNLTVSEVQSTGGVRQVVRSEVHRNLSMNSFASNYAVDAVRAGSNLIRLERPAGLNLATAITANGAAHSGTIRPADLNLLGDDARRLAIAVDGGATYEFDFLGLGDPLLGNFALQMKTLAKRIEDAVLLLDPGFTGFTCKETVNGMTDGFLTATAGTAAAAKERSSVTFSTASQRNAAGILKLGTANGGREIAAVAAIRPVHSGTAWPSQPQPFDFTKLPAAASIDVDILDAAGTVAFNKVIPLWSAAPADLEGVRAALETALKAEARPEFKAATVSIVDGQIVVVPGGDKAPLRFRFNSGTVTTHATPIDLVKPNAVENIAAYQLGIGPPAQAQSTVSPGANGTVPTSATIFTGSLAGKTGMYALEDVDLFNILMLPDQSDPSLQAEAVAYAKKRRAFALLDLPATVDTLAEAKAWITAVSTPHDANAAAYFPRILMADPLRDNRIYAFANCGAIAGLYARTDNERGVWKAPAGTAARLTGVLGVEYVLTDAENGVLNPLGLNAVRSFPVYGNIAWGARTLMGADAQASEWKYIPIRRLALFLEESLYRGTQWVVFEPNDEPLWAQIRLNIGAFLQGLFRQGAFQGMTPKEAYFVKCDRETTTQADINNGIVNILVGFAPLKPAEFVVLKIQQMAGDIPT